jgi:hypothetical protein
MRIIETNIGGHIIIREACDVCEKCGEEKTNIMLFGEVCVHCDVPDKNFLEGCHETLSKM